MMTKDLGIKDIEKIPYAGSSRMELKRSHQWLTEPSASERLSNKRPVMEFDAHMNLSAWDNSLVPTQLTDCVFNPANAHLSHPHGRHISLIVGQHVQEEQCNTVSSIRLPVVHGTSVNLDTIRKVKANNMSESDNMSEFMLQRYAEGVSRSFETGPSYNISQDSTLSLGKTGITTNIDKRFIFPGAYGSKAYGNSVRNFSNEGVGVIPMGGICDKGEVFSTYHPIEKGVENFLVIGQSLQNDDCNIFSMILSYNKGQDNFMSLLSCDKIPQNDFMTESSYQKESANVLSGDQSPYAEGGEMAFVVSSQDRADQNNDQISNEGRSETISFGDYQKETTIGSSVRVNNSHENFSLDPETTKNRLHKEAEENMSFEFRSPPYAIPRVDTLLVPKSKDPKAARKHSTNTFPTNVKSLLSTGMFDGVTVKYYSWSREKNLKGIIKGTGYLCGCDNCNLTKDFNAYEFEQHANCKTKHPNNHIYFENGKTIYGVVQELKNTPQKKLFDAIQNVIGSGINHKNFNSWKASYQVTSLELQRIYGKDDVTLAS